MLKSRGLYLLASLCIYCAFPAFECAGSGGYQIVTGSCSVLDGPASQLGRQFVMGATAYLNTINSGGGVYGRKIVLRAHEDAYDPAKTQTCFTQLQQEPVFAGSFFVGTPTAARYVPLAEAN